MTFDVRLLPNTRRDFERIEAYHDAEAPSQTERFIEQFTATLDWIAEHAAMPAIDDLGLRHVSLKVFRYHVWYRVLDGSTIVQVVAVLHHSRAPEEIAGRAING